MYKVRFFRAVDQDKLQEQINNFFAANLVTPSFLEYSTQRIKTPTETGIRVDILHAVCLVYWQSEEGGTNGK